MKNNKSMYKNLFIGISTWFPWYSVYFKILKRIQLRAIEVTRVSMLRNLVLLAVQYTAQQETMQVMPTIKKINVPTGRTFLGSNMMTLQIYIDV